MEHAAATFEQIAVETERTSALASLAKTTTNIALEIALVFLLGWSLDRLVKRLNDDYISKMTAEQAQELKASLQSLYATLQRLHKVGFGRNPLIRNMARGIWDRAEDLSDLIEVLVLRDNSDFQHLISRCSSEVGIL